MNWLKVPKKVYFKTGCYPVALKELDEVYGFGKAFIISDANLYTTGVVEPIKNYLKERGLAVCEFFTLSETPCFADARSGLQKMLEFEPDVIVGMGDGAVMSMAKIMLLLYENPDIDLDKVAKDFKKTSVSEAEFPTIGAKAKLVLITTTAGSGMECSPYAVIANDQGKKVVISSFKLVPEIAVIDGDLAIQNTPEQNKEAAIQTIANAARAYASPSATDYMKGFARDAVRVVFENLPTVLENGPKAPRERENLINAAAIAGMAIGSAVDTIDPDAGAYPSANDKNAKKVEKERLTELAKAAGVADDFDSWIAACEKLAAL